MKTISLTFFLFLTIHAFGQFPAPTNFSVQGKYVHMNDCDFCLGPHTICGPDYCSTYSWSMPDTSSITAKLDHFNIYNQLYSNSIELLGTTQANQNGLWLNTYPQGNLWVTAVYVNPSGESQPSNVYFFNYGLPIEVPIVKQADKIKIQYDNALQVLRLQSAISPTKLNLINTDGKIIKEFDNPDTELKLTDLPRGFYVVEVYTSENEVFRQKIIK